MSSVLNIALKFRNDLPDLDREVLCQAAPLKGPGLGVNLGRPYVEKRKKLSKLLHLDHIWVPKKLRKAVITTASNEKKNLIYMPSNGGVLRVTPHSPGEPERDRWIYTRRLIKDVKSYSKRVSMLSYMIHCITQQGLNPASWKLLKRLHLVCFTTHIDNLRKMVGRVARDCGIRYDIRSPWGVYTGPSIRLQRDETKTFSYEGIELPVWKTKTFPSQGKAH